MNDNFQLLRISNDFIDACEEFSTLNVIEIIEKTPLSRNECI